MATLKLGPTGKLALCGSGALRVSCCPGDDCCLYPSIAYGVGYFFADLPDEITIVYDSGSPPGPTLPKYEDVIGTRDGYSTAAPGAAVDGDWALVADHEATQWDFYVMALGEWEYVAGTLCLILGPDESFKSQDLFPDIYTAEYGEFDPLEIPRVTLCLWQETGTTPPPGEVPYILEVGYGLYPGEPYKWGAIMRITEELPDYGVKDDPQSSPEGEYVFDSSVVMTVSV